jgi:hypothetical protein
MQAARRNSVSVIHALKLAAELFLALSRRLTPPEPPRPFLLNWQDCFKNSPLLACRQRDRTLFHSEFSPRLVPQADTSGTAKAISADLARLTAENDWTDDSIERVRDVAEQMAGGGPSHTGVSPVPEDALGGHAYHTYSMVSQ